MRVDPSQQERLQETQQNGANQGKSIFNHPEFSIDALLVGDRATFLDMLFELSTPPVVEKDVEIDPSFNIARERVELNIQENNEDTEEISVDEPIVHQVREPENNPSEEDLPEQQEVRLQDIPDEQIAPSEDIHVELEQPVPYEQEELESVEVALASLNHHQSSSKEVLPDEKSQTNEQPIIETKNKSQDSPAPSEIQEIEKTPVYQKAPESGSNEIVLPEEQELPLDRPNTSRSQGKEDVVVQKGVVEVANEEGELELEMFYEEGAFEESSPLYDQDYSQISEEQPVLNRNAAPTGQPLIDFREVFDQKLQPGAPKAAMTEAKVVNINEAPLQPTTTSNSSDNEQSFMRENPFEAKTTKHASKERQARVSRYTSKVLQTVKDVLKNVNRSTDSNKLTVRLDPPELGELSIDLSVKGGELHARFSAENSEVLNILKAKAFDLQELLRSVSSQLGGAIVSFDSGGGNTGQSQFADNNGDPTHNSWFSSEEGMEELERDGGEEVKRDIGRWIA